MFLKPSEFFSPGPKIPMPGSYLLHPHIPGKAKNGLNQGPGPNYIFLCAVTGAFIITAPGIFGVAIGTDVTEANNSEK